MKTLVALAALAVALPLQVGISASADAVAAACEGLPATIVGSAGTVAYGTEGDDVIVSNGSNAVFGRGGNDTICTIGSTRDVMVAGGAGDDLVDRRGDLDPAAGSLVFEANTFYGNDGPDVVTVTTTNTVATGGGDDFVTFGDTAAPHNQVSGTIDLGGGDDRFLEDGENGPPLPPSIRSADGPRLTVVGGRGDDHLTWFVFDAGRWTFDVTHGRVFTRTLTSLAFAGFEHYETAARVERAKVDFVGSRRAESFSGSFDADIVTSVHMGGGDDEVLLDACAMCASARRTTIDAGAGRDLLKVSQRDLPRGDDKVSIDLSRHRMSRSLSGTTYGTDLTGVEDVQVWTDGEASITGDGRANDLRSWGCRRNVVSGGGGDDVVSYLRVFQFGDDHTPMETPTSCGKRVVNVRADGGPGNDLLVGGRGADLLIGGPGHDRARAGQGSDRCAQLEVRRGCERG